jgi:mono/diheme cytochrome c family protein
MKQITILLIFLTGTTLLADAEKGKAVYAANCAICHTVNGGDAIGHDFKLVYNTIKK